MSKENHVLYGRHAVLEALKAERSFEKIFLLHSREPSSILLGIRRMSESAGIPVVFAPREKLNSLAGTEDHQGVVGILSTSEYAEFSTFLEKPKKLLLVLDHLEDPQNLGALLRTCDAVSVDGVIIPRRRAVGLTPGVAKASAGAIAYVPVARVGNIHQTLLLLRKRGFTIIGADQSGSHDYTEIEYPKPLALVLGNEHKGLSLLIKNTCDSLVKIPMKGHLGSLNVSVAGGVLLFQIDSQWKNQLQEKREK